MYFVILFTDLLMNQVWNISHFWKSFSLIYLDWINCLATITFQRYSQPQYMKYQIWITNLMCSKMLQKCVYFQYFPFYKYSACRGHHLLQKSNCWREFYLFKYLERFYKTKQNWHQPNGNLQNKRLTTWLRPILQYSTDLTLTIDITGKYI